jgi:hypothetical protein
MKIKLKNLGAIKQAEFEIWQKKIQLSNLELGELKRMLANLKQQRNLEKNNKEIVISSSR